MDLARTKGELEPMDAFRYDGKRVLVVGGASGNGVTVLVDAGHVRSGLTGSFDAPIIKMILGVEYPDPLRAGPPRRRDEGC